MKATANIPIGAQAERFVEVSRDLTVAHFHNDMPEVYGTPMMIYLMEVAAAAAIEEYLPEGWISVGAAVNVKHLAATPIGFRVKARAEVVEVTDSTITFTVEAHDGIEKIGEGIHVRAPVNMERFMQRVKAKTGR